ncbi:RHS repeat-associated core domain protein [Actinoplanes sp. N902-109]|uniref:RHS repeat-associated core domain protein n=1 Tax=Actinoplanes sp. (strain N902-109) TaxID=649831 RepID=UPI00032967AD|nr:RHS repeat-associated core domain protein [Actinoplanes sp. N902-109]AGL19615.1 RHS repeat-associated core domain protein [Actinoplanes sp. N902-109]
MAWDAVSGTVYLSEATSCQVDAVDAEGTLRVVIGNGCNDGLAIPGPAAETAIGAPQGIAVHDGDLFVADGWRAVIYRIDARGTLSIFAGTGNQGAPTAGPARESSLGDVGDLAVGGDTLYFTDRVNHAIGAIDLTSGQLSIVAGNGQEGVPARSTRTGSCSAWTSAAWSSGLRWPGRSAAR